jgi:hypothetical protein
MKKALLILFLWPVLLQAQYTNIVIGTAANDNTGDTLRSAFSKINTNFVTITNQVATLSNLVVTSTAVGKMDTNNGTATRALINGIINPQNSTYGATGSVSVDDQLPIQSAFNAAANGGSVVFPAGGATYKFTGTLWLTNSNVTIDGNGATLYSASDVRMITVSNVSNVHIKNFTLQGLTNGTTQAGIRFVNATNCTYENIIVNNSALNGFEITQSSRVHGENNVAYKPGAFGVFYYLSQDCSDAHTYIEQPGSFAYEFKDSKRCYGRQVDIINPLAEYAVYFWTGFGTSPEIPGAMLTEDCGMYDLYVEGGANTKELAYFNASPRCFIRGAYLKPHINGVWGIADINATFFYNEGSAMTGSVVTGTTNITSVSNASQIKAGDRIHISGSATNHTVFSVVSTTVNLLTTNDITAASATLGFVSQPDYTDIQDVTIVGRGSAATGGINSIQIAGTAGDPLMGIYLKNIRVLDSANYAMNVQHATVRVEGGVFRDSVGLQEWHLDIGANVQASKVQFQSKTNLDSYGIYTQSGAILSAIDCEFRDFGIAGISPHAPADLVFVKGGLFHNILTQPLGLYANSSVYGARFTSNLWTLGTFESEIRVYGTNNNIMGCTFDPGASPWIAQHIGEQTGSTGNKYIGNNYMGGLENDVAYASGSTSIRVGPTDTRFNAVTVTTLTNTGILTGVVGTDANGKNVKATLSGLTWDGTTLTASGGGGGSGEANTASSLGNGYKLTYDKTSVDLRFNTLTNDSSLTISSNANMLTFGVATSGITSGLIAADSVALGTKTTGNYVANAATGAGLSGGSSGSESAALTLLWDPSTFVNNVTLWDSANASRTITFGLSGATDPVLTLGNNSFDITTGVLKVAGATVLTTASIADTAWASSWDAVTTISPSKNAVYDWGHAFDTDDDGKVNVLDIAAGIPKTDSSGVVSLATLGTDYLDSTYISDNAYNATTWDADTTHAPSKNAIRDKIEALSAGSSIFVNAASVSAPNFIGAQFTSASTNVSLVSTMVATNNTLVGNSIDLGTSTNVTIDPLIANWTWSPSTNARFSFATNTISDTNKVYVVHLAINAGNAQQITNVADTLNAQGNWGVMKAGTNNLDLVYQFGAWFIQQNTAQQDATTIGPNGVVSNAEFEFLDGVTSAIQTQLDTKTTASGGALTANSIVLGAGSKDLKVVAGLTTDGTDKITLGTVDFGGTTDTTVARASAGDISVEGNRIFRVGGADVPVADGGTGLSSGTSGGVLAYTASGTLASSAALAGNALVLGGGAGVVPLTAAGLTTDGTSVLTLGVAGTSVGGLALKNATSGTITINPPTGALGTATVTVPATTGTLYITGGTDVAVADGGTGLSSGTSGGILGYTASGTLASSAALTANAVVVGGGAGATPTASAVSIASGVVTGATFDSQGSGNVLKLLDYKDLVYPSRFDGVGATGVTNDYTSGLWGLVTYNGTADTNGNYAVFRLGTVPYDLDTGTTMKLRGLSIRVSATDTDAAEFSIGLWSPASSSAYSPTDFTSFSTFINFDSGTLTSPAANDIFYFSDVTLTGWAAAVTAGRPFIIGIARRNGANDDSVTILSGTIEYGRSQ